MGIPLEKKKKKPKRPSGNDQDDVVRIGKDGSMEVSRKKGIPVRRPPPDVEKRLKLQQEERLQREEQLKADRIKTAKRYESMKLYQDAIKYFKMADADDEAERIRSLMSESYLSKAREFESRQKYDEAMHLYDILGMKEDVNRLQSMVDTKVLVDDDEDDIDPTVINAFHPMNGPSRPMELEPVKDDVRDSSRKDTNEEGKSFSICPYCGESLNLPRKPKFCPYCREPF